MADYYTYFSIVLKLPDLAAQQYALALHAKAKALTYEDEIPADIPKDLHANLSMWFFDAEANNTPEAPGIWIYSEQGGVDAVCDFIQHLLRKFNPQGHVAFEWSNDCSKPRTDAYGGGAAFITAKRITSMSTWEWIARKTRRHSKPS